MKRNVDEQEARGFGKEFIAILRGAGRFLLTGSARVPGGWSRPDVLPGRIETIELWPLSQGEIAGTPDVFVDAVFAHGVGLARTSDQARADYIDRITRGGFPESIARAGRRPEGFLDSYVADIINRTSSSCRRSSAAPGCGRSPAGLYHCRTRDNVEVDLILEDRRGQVVAIEVKASSTVEGEDFRGLRHLADRLGDDLLAGIVLYTGQQTLPFGPGFRAMPVAAIWEVTLGEDA
jgi:predicted AAA+ superfamily ATPase